MKMSNETFDRIKWFALVFIPAFEVLILTLGKIWSVPYYSEIGASVAALGVFLAALIRTSSNAYYTEIGEAVAVDDKDEYIEETDPEMLEYGQYYKIVGSQNEEDADPGEEVR